MLPLGLRQTGEGVGGDKGVSDVVDAELKRGDGGVLWPLAGLAVGGKKSPAARGATVTAKLGGSGARSASPMRTRWKKR